MSNFRVDAAFRSSRKDECYLFMKDKYVVVNYSPGTMKDDLLNGPIHICDGFRMISKTPFENGIDCAFDTDGNEAFIFAGNQCARIDYAPHSPNAKMLTLPMLIGDMFPCLNGTGFENGIDAAIRTVRNDVFLFKGNMYARMDCDSKNVASHMLIRDAFNSFIGTVFENRIDAAFASHVKDEAYIFKGEYYARINVAPDTHHDDFIVGNRIRRILDDWSSLGGILQS